MNKIQAERSYLTFYARAFVLARIGYDRDTLFHVLEVSSKCHTFKQKTLAILHDLIEDTEFTICVLQHYGFNAEILIALDCITRRKEETYFQYIERVKENKLASYVKLKDLEVNISRCKNKAKGNLLNRYIKAKRILI
jgi:(p)ppGpp synthase/HD superfamily hydrolase